MPCCSLSTGLLPSGNSGRELFPERVDEYVGGAGTSSCFFIVKLEQLPE
jgi:hypothetical protein